MSEHAASHDERAEQALEQDEANGSPGRGLRLLLIADPGLPSRRVESVKEELENRLQKVFGPPVQVHSRTEIVRIRPDNTVDVSVARNLMDELEGIDLAIILTEIPRHTRGRPLIADVLPDDNVAVVSCPTLGAWATKRRLLKLFVGCAAELAPEAVVEDPGAYTRGWDQWKDESNGEGRRTLHARRPFGVPRTVLGMVMSNDPWRTAPRLSSALAAASATGAFGIFYSSIWAMASYLSLPRLLLIGLLAMSTMVLWLIVSNRLWDKPVQERLGPVIALYNASTIVTLFLAVLVLYLVLVVAILLIALVVIDPEYMGAIVEEEATFGHYMDVAWMSAAMGVVAGSLGSSFDSETDLRQLTHGQRERQRRYSEEEWNGEAETDRTDS